MTGQRTDAGAGAATDQEGAAEGDGREQGDDQTARQPDRETLPSAVVFCPVIAFRNGDFALLVAHNDRSVERSVPSCILVVRVNPVEIGHRLVFARILRSDRDIRLVSHPITPVLCAGPDAGCGPRPHSVRHP